jgi:hypothetical protein
MSLSFLTWVDFDSDQKKKMAEVIRLFSEQGVRDELGFGTVRDVIADKLFPGTSTIQTRAKYFLFVPYIFLKLQDEASRSKKLRNSPDRMKKFVEDEEQNLRNHLITLEDSSGTFGKRNEKLERYPNEVYWAGLKKWGIFKDDVGRSAYYEELTQRIEIFKDWHKKNIDDENDYNQKPSRFWNAEIENLYNDKDVRALYSFELHKKEASFLRAQINECCNDSLLNSILSNEVQIEDIDIFWDLKIRKVINEQFKDILFHSKQFSLLVCGAVRAYFYYCASKLETPLLDDYEGFFEEWFVESKKSEFSSWSTEDFFNYLYTLDEKANVHLTKVFSRQFKEEFDAASTYKDMLESNSLLKLIQKRELDLKKIKRARLSNDEPLKRWGNSLNGVAFKAYGPDFRWRQSKRIILDIFNGLGIE